MTPEHRPMYHFLPPANWLNDPNGLIQHEGVWHLFYQHNPNGAFWGTMHWGHATSEDLVHWRHLPIALAPEPGGPDADGCYSGATVVHEGVPTIVYTGVRRPAQLPCLATSADPHLETWQKDPANPVIREVPSDLDVTIFRDHTLWREGGVWMMGVGAGIRDQGGAVLLYRSEDLRSWEYLHPLAIEQPELNPGGRLLSTGWECPDFFFLDHEPVLIACDWDGEAIGTSYWTGTYADRRFEATRKGTVDPGLVFYAPQSATDRQGRRVMFGWLRESRSDAAQRASGWSGVMSLPRIVSAGPDGTLAFAVAPEVDTLRGECVRLEAGEGRVHLGSVAANRMELAVRFQPAGNVELEVCRSRDGEEHTVVLWDAASGTLSLDTTESSSDPTVWGEVASALVPLAGGEDISLRIFVDASVVEVYANERIAISGRIYPVREIDAAIRVVAGSGVIRSMNAFGMAVT